MIDATTVAADRALLDDHVERFNRGIRSGDFGPMLERFTPDAVLEFQGVPVGPFRGRDAIAAAYDENPPDDEIEILQATGDERVIEAVYAWRRDGGVPAGRMIFDVDGGRISGLVVTFESFDSAPSADGAGRP